MCFDWQRKKTPSKSFIQSLKKDLSEKSQKTLKSERTAKQLLGELYTDKKYLEKLLKDEGLFLYTFFAYVEKKQQQILFLKCVRPPGCTGLKNKQSNKQGFGTQQLNMVVCTDQWQSVHYTLKSHYYSEYDNVYNSIRYVRERAYAVWMFWILPYPKCSIFQLRCRICLYYLCFRRTLCTCIQCIQNMNLSWGSYSSLQHVASCLFTDSSVRCTQTN